jgi:hypothetical protein
MPYIVVPFILVSGDCDLTVPFEYTAKWHNNAKTMIDIIKSEWKS